MTFSVHRSKVQPLDLLFDASDIGSLPFQDPCVGEQGLDLKTTSDFD
jgi:hypothetical protein